MKGRGVLLAALAATLPVGAGLVAPLPLLAQSARPFDPPAAPLVLTRTVSRSLADGGAIVARRSYRVRFEPVTDGFRLDGELIDSHVEAPQALRALALLEEGRSDRGLFPIRLDRAGRIRDHSAPHSLGRHGDEAGAARALLEKAALAPAERSEAVRFTDSLLANGGPAAWPEDLFAPRPGAATEQRRIALPGGREGLVTIAVAATVDGPGGLVGSLTRTVTTALDGTTRTTREEWTLAAS